jgi:hypothetical protein
LERLAGIITDRCRWGTPVMNGGIVPGTCRFQRQRKCNC